MGQAVLSVIDFTEHRNGAAKKHSVLHVVINSLPYNHKFRNKSLPSESLGEAVETHS